MLAFTGLSAVLWLDRSAAQSAPFGLDFVPTTASLVMLSLGLLAVPAALAAGLAVAEFAIIAATAAVAEVHRPLTRVRDRGVLRGVRRSTLRSCRYRWASWLLPGSCGGALGGYAAPRPPASATS